MFQFKTRRSVKASGSRGEVLPKIGIDDIAPPVGSHVVQLPPDEVINSLWETFWINYDAFVTGKMKPEDEVSYFLFNTPGPSQYSAFVQFFDFFDEPKEQLWELKRYMYTHDLAAMGETEEKKPAIVLLLKNLIEHYVSQGVRVMLVSGSLWKNHIATRCEIGDLFRLLHERNVRLRMITQAKRDEEHVNDFISLLGRDSRFGIYGRIPLHFMCAGDDFLFFEFPHTESSMYRLNMLVDLNTLRYKPGKTKAGLLKFLDNLVKRAV